jgi:hypothetical protein
MAFPFVLRLQRYDGMPIGASLWRISQTAPKLAAGRPVRRFVLIDG